MLLFAWSNTLVSSHSIQCCCPQACSAMADFSVSPSGGGSVFLYVGLESSLHLPYIHMAATARDLVHNFRLLLQRVLVLDFCQLSANQKTVQIWHVPQSRICTTISYGTVDAKVTNTDSLSHPACVKQ